MANIGIDLGTSNSLIGVFENGGVSLIPNGLNEWMTPSVVGVDEQSEVIVGKAAQERLATHPHLTVSVFKPFTGTGKRYQLGAQSFSIEALSALVLKSLKQDAEAYLQGQSIDNVIISVPAYFNNTQRHAVKSAALIAGLQVEKVISEPTAAALSYGMNKAEFEAQFMVLDLGGGTFDVSLMEQFDGVFDIKASAGNNRLGGEDFLDLLVENFLDYYQIDRALLTAHEFENIRCQCENLKRNLTETDGSHAPIKIKDNVFSFKMSNDNFEVLAKPLLEQFRAPIARVLKDTQVGIHLIDYIVLVGGASRMPIFRNLIQSFFPESEIIEHDPDTAVVRGATMQSELDADNSAIQEFVVTDVTAYTLGVDAYSGIYDKNIYLPIIERNSPIPISKSTELTKRSVAQKEMKIDIYQGESLDPKKNLKLGTIEIPTPWLDIETRVEVQLTCDYNGLIAVDVKVADCNIHQQMLIQNEKTILTEAQLQEQMQKIEALKILPRSESENRLIIAKLERLYEETLGTERERVDIALKRFMYALNRADKMQQMKEKKLCESFLQQYVFETV